MYVSVRRLIYTLFTEQQFHLVLKLNGDRLDTKRSSAIDNSATGSNIGDIIRIGVIEIAVIIEYRWNV